MSPRKERTKEDAFKDAVRDIQGFINTGHFIGAVQLADGFMRESCYGRRPAMLYLRAQALLMLGKPEEALVDIKSVEAQNHANQCSALLLQGNIKIQLGVDAGAIEAANQVIDLCNPWNYWDKYRILQAKIILALANLHLGNKEKVKEHANRAIQLASELIITAENVEHHFTQGFYRFRAEARLLIEDYSGAESDASESLTGIDEGYIAGIHARDKDFIAMLSAFMTRAKARLLLENAIGCLSDVGFILKYQPNNKMALALQFHATKLHTAQEQRQLFLDTMKLNPANYSLTDLCREFILNKSTQISDASLAKLSKEQANTISRLTFQNENNQRRRMLWDNNGIGLLENTFFNNLRRKARGLDVSKEAPDAAQTLRA